MAISRKYEIYDFNYNFHLTAALFIYFKGKLAALNAQQNQLIMVTLEPAVLDKNNQLITITQTIKKRSILNWVYRERLRHL